MRENMSIGSRVKVRASPSTNFKISTCIFIFYLHCPENKIGTKHVWTKLIN
jgi:hypothetical protein